MLQSIVIDETHMRHALHLAGQGRGMTGLARPSVGCVLVKNNRVIAAARTGNEGVPHAEAAALAQAGPQAKGATAYVTLEPCAHQGRTPPCADALVAAGIARCVIGCSDPFKQVNGQGIEILRRAGIDVQIGVLEAEARMAHAGFLSMVEKKRPYTTLKLACSADGKITTGDLAQPWITGEEARRHGHLVRTQSDAILVGAGTVLADDPMLTARLPGCEKTGLLRVVLDSRLRTPLGSNLVKTAQDTQLLIFYTQAGQEAVDALQSKGAELIKLPGERPDPLSVAQTLAARGVMRLLVEGGVEIWRVFMEAGLVDEILLYRAPHSIGPAGKLQEIVDNPENPTWRDRFSRIASRTLGEDLLEIYRARD